jgi:hypothetical protein
VGAVSELPAELVIGWSLWVVGGLLLTLWFLRRSASPRTHHAAPQPPTGMVRLSGTHAVARSGSGSHVAAGRPSSGVHAPDAFDELRALLDPPQKPPSTMG